MKYKAATQLFGARPINTGRANSPNMWTCQFATSGSTSGSSGSKLTLHNNKIIN